MFQECFLEYYKSQYKNMQHYFSMAATYCDPDGIHDMRVEVKRLRAFFKLLEWITPAFQVEKNIRNLRKLFKAAAEIRDVHVQQELTREWAKKFHLTLSEYYNFLKQKEIPARKHFSRFAKSFDIHKEFEKNENKMRRSLKKRTDEYAAVKTRARVDRLINGIIEFGNENRLQEEYLHKVRILAKETRYTIEAARQCFPELGYSDELNKRLRGLHQVLGKWHDADIALEHVETFQAESLENPPLRGVGGCIPPLKGVEACIPPLRGARGVSNYTELCKHLQQEKTDLLTTFEERWDDFVIFISPPTPVNYTPT